MLISAAGFFAAAVDVGFHALRIGLDIPEEATSLALATLLIAGGAHLLPLGVALRCRATGLQLHKWDTLVLLVLALAVSVSLFGLGTTNSKIIVGGATALTAASLTSLLCYQRYEACNAVLLLHLGLGLVAFLGSGYWVGPAFLMAALIVSAIRRPSHWWPHRQCAACRRLGDGSGTVMRVEQLI